MSEVLSQEWRVEHCTKGDEALRVAYANLEQIAGTQPVEKTMAASQLAGAYAAIAQAHYAAANVRARPAASPTIYGPEMSGSVAHLYRLEGVPGEWQLVARTGGHGSVAGLQFHKIEGS